MEKKREDWLDSLKGLGILFVVLGHCFPPQQPLTDYLYSFHIPLFFFVSGYLFSVNSRQEAFKTFLAKRFKRLMVPYFAYGAFTYLVWLIIGRNFGVNKELAVPALKPLIGLFYGNGFDNYLVFNIAIWFLPALFISTVLYFWVCRLVRKRISLFITSLLILCLGLLDSRYNPIRLPWGINISFVAVFFIYLGQQGKALLRLIWQQRPYIKIFLGLVLIFIGYFLQNLNTGVSFNSHSYGNIVYFIVSAGSSILGYAIITKELLNMKILQFLGINSLRILALHILSFSLISAFIKYGLGGSFQVFKVSLTGRLSYFIGSIVIVSLYSIIINKIAARLSVLKFHKE